MTKGFAFNPSQEEGPLIPDSNNQENPIIPTIPEHSKPKGFPMVWIRRKTLYPSPTPIYKEVPKWVF